MRARLALLVLVTACVTRQVTPRMGTATAVAMPDDVETIVRLALALDAAGDRAADTLYTPDAVVIGNARVRLAAPRFAGVGFGGKVTVAAAAVTVSGRFAWVTVDYRWANVAQRQAEAGRATFICERREGAKAGSGWKIVHAHSSQQLPWER